MPHQHTYHVTADIVLTLPDALGWRDKLFQFDCPGCGRFSLITGSFHVDSGAVALPELTARAAQERHAGSPLARVAQQAETVRVPHPRYHRRK